MLNLQTCMRRPKCNKKFLKKDGIPRLNKWFCSDECVESDTDQQLFFSKQRVNEPIEEEKNSDDDSDDTVIDL